ncbi:hypothetical protein C5167_005094 [Papaver somniferum]|uniref:Uncharacterized protein n=1 Tax=Papaver somniferum TaxID=3469 RepID=A0A4Y7JDG2_PAPSO|nr:hypothetical protein C5167_005094 [Papaver somniferum]
MIDKQTDQEKETTLIWDVEDCRIELGKDGNSNLSQKEDCALQRLVWDVILGLI